MRPDRRTRILGSDLAQSRLPSSRQIGGRGTPRCLWETQFLCQGLWTSPRLRDSRGDRPSKPPTAPCSRPNRSAGASPSAPPSLWRPMLRGRYSRGDDDRPRARHQSWAVGLIGCDAVHFQITRPRDYGPAGLLLPQAHRLRSPSAAARDPAQNKPIILRPDKEKAPACGRRQMLSRGRGEAQ